MARLDPACRVGYRPTFVNRLRNNTSRRALLSTLVLLCALVFNTTPARAEANDHAPAVHKIYPGQTLGMIAKRYRVGIDALCNANGIARNHKIRPGDKLVVPALADKDGSEAKAQRKRLLGDDAPSDQAKGKTKAEPPAAKSRPAPSKNAAPESVRKHQVYSGQTLGMIAKRYRITLDALCNANAITRATTINPGDELLVPPRDDRDGSATRKLLAKSSHDVASPSPKSAASAAEPRVHLVVKGDTLGGIANKYGTSIGALTHANAISRSTRLHLGRELVVPARGDADGKAARAWWKREKHAHDNSKQSERNWRDYKKQAWKRGYITLESPNGKKRWKGYVIGPGNKLLPLARQKVTGVLASWRTGKTKTIDSRLVKLIARVSDTFGGRTIRVVSGYREHSHSASSRHPEGKALDFSVHGVPNWALRDYLRTLGAVGVGYYPNSSFVHLDVRDTSTYWVDVSKPGEAPRYTHRSKGRTN